MASLEISKNTVLPGLTVGFLLFLIGVVAAGVMEYADVAHRIDVVEAGVTDVRDRQSKYIGQSGSLTEQVRELEREIQRLRERIVVLETT